MSFGFSITDAAEVVRYGYKLYHNGFCVARDADESYLSLLDELFILSRSLHTVVDAASSGALPSTGQADHVGRAVSRCRDVLKAFTPILDRYEKLESSDRRLIPKRLQYVVDQPKINNLRESLSAALKLLATALQSVQYLGLHSNSSDPSRPHQNPIRVASRPEQLLAVPQTGNRNAATDQDERWRPAQGGTLDLDGTTLVSSPNPLRFVEPGDDKTDSSSVDEFKKIRETRKRHALPESIIEVLREHYNSLRVYSQLEWLFFATWWYLKARSAWEICNSQSSADIQRVATDTTRGAHSVAHFSLEQALADFAKASFILDFIIFDGGDDEDGLGQTLSKSTYRDVKSLSDSIDDGFSELKLAKTFEQTSDLHQQDLSLLEWHLHGDEDSSSVFYQWDSFDAPNRFFTAKLRHAGHASERPLFRTFVKAEIGKAENKIAATYMLILFAKKGCSDIFLSLVNQSRTVNLSRVVTPKYLDNKFLNIVHSTLEIRFPSQGLPVQGLKSQDLVSKEDTTIEFANPEELRNLQQFLERHFEAQQPRLPRSCELLLFRDGVESCTFHPPDQLDTSQRKLAACEVSLYSVFPEETWKTTRRIVISSIPSADDKAWCYDEWLPLSEVQVHREGCLVILRWSDFRHYAGGRTDGYYGQLHTFKYDAKSPNQELEIEFNEEQSAELFEESIIFPFETQFSSVSDFVSQKVEFESATDGRKMKVYKIFDRGNQSMHYHGILVTTPNSNLSRCSQAFFASKLVDFQIALEKDLAVVYFPRARRPDYKSDCVDEQIPMKDLDDILAARREELHLGSIDLAIRPFRFSFDGFSGVQEFLSSLTYWKLEFVKTTHLVSVYRRHPKWFGVDHPKMTVSVWSKEGSIRSNNLRLAMRSKLGSLETGRSNAEYTHDHTMKAKGSRDEHPKLADGIHWITANLSSPPNHSNGSKTIIFKEICVTQGDDLDCETMSATGDWPRNQHPNRPYHVELKFENAKHAEEFLEQVQDLLNTWHTPKKSKQNQKEVEPDVVEIPSTFTENGHRQVSSHSTDSATRRTKDSISELERRATSHSQSAQVGPLSPVEEMSPPPRTRLPVPDVTQQMASPAISPQPGTDMEPLVPSIREDSTLAGSQVSVTPSAPVQEGLPDTANVFEGSAAFKYLNDEFSKPGSKAEQFGVNVEFPELSTSSLLDGHADTLNFFKEKADLDDEIFHSRDQIAPRTNILLIALLESRNILLTCILNISKAHSKQKDSPASFTALVASKRPSVINLLDLDIASVLKLTWEIQDTISKIWSHQDQTSESQKWTSELVQRLEMTFPATKDATLLTRSRQTALELASEGESELRFKQQLSCLYFAALFIDASFVSHLYLQAARQSSIRDHEAAPINLRPSYMRFHQLRMSSQQLPSLGDLLGQRKLLVVSAQSEKMTAPLCVSTTISVLGSLYGGVQPQFVDAEQQGSAVKSFQVGKQSLVPCWHDKTLHPALQDDECFARWDRAGQGTGQVMQNGASGQGANAFRAFANEHSGKRPVLRIRGGHPDAFQFTGEEQRVLICNE